MQRAKDAGSAIGDAGESMPAYTCRLSLAEEKDGLPIRGEPPCLTSSRAAYISAMHGMESLLSDRVLLSKERSAAR